jgi:hypothetical protein
VKSERWGKGKCRRFRQRCQPHSPRTVGALFADATPFLDPCQREGQRGQIRVHLQNSKLDYCTFQHNLHFPPRSSRTQFEAYGVTIASGLGECRWQSLRTNCWKRQPLLPGLHIINDWTSAQWPFRPQYVLPIFIDGTIADSRGRPVHRQHRSSWNTCFVSHCVR